MMRRRGESLEKIHMIYVFSYLPSLLREEVLDAKEMFL